MVRATSVQGVVTVADSYVFITAGIAAGIYVYVAIIWCILRRRRCRGAPRSFEKNASLELTYTIVPLLIVFGGLFARLRVEGSVDGVAADPLEKIGVLAFRWSWPSQYLGTNVTSIGTSRHPRTLYLPIGKLDLTADVNHSFWVLAFFWCDAISGIPNVLDVTPNRLDTFEGRFAQFCGLDHASVGFAIKGAPASAVDLNIASSGRQTP